MIEYLSTYSYAVKRAVRKSLRGVGLDVKRYVPEHDPVHCFQQLVRSVAPTVYVDLGCNRGQFFQEYVKPIRKQWSVAIFVDPIEEALEDLRDKNEGLLFPAYYYAAAVLDRRGDARLNVSARETSSSILEVTPESTSRIHDTASTQTRRVRQDTLPGLLGQRKLSGPALMKIDVQGAEMPVLHGLGPMLDQVAILRLEMSSVELYRGQALGAHLLGWLSDHDFEIVGVEPGWMDAETGICIQWDVTVIANSHLAEMARVRTACGS